MLGVREDVMKLAHGRWPSILMHFGIDEKAVSGKHSPCPMCEGKDRFRLISGENGGRWICNQCGSGDGMDMLQALLKCDFKTAAEKLRPVVFGMPMAPPTRGPSEMDKKKYLRTNVDMWKRASPNDERLAEYLNSRGLLPEEYGGADLRFDVVPYYDKDVTGKKMLPCMLSRISSREGKLAAIHRTYLHPDGEGYRTKKKITKPSREWRGGAIRLFQTKSDTRLIVAEGIETALSVRAKILRTHGVLVPCWAGVSANNLERIAVPEHIKTVMIAGDNDESFTGQKSAFILANKMAVHDKRKCTVVLPDGMGDFNDQLRKDYG